MNYIIILHYLKKYGGNSNLLSKLLQLSRNEITNILELLITKYNLSLFALIQTEIIGLNKAVSWCDKSPLKYSTAKKLTGPLTSLFRGDIEENKFMLMYYINDKYSNVYKETLDKVFHKTNSLCETHIITKYYRFVNYEGCYDFTSRKWICNEKEVYISSPSNDFINLDKHDVQLIVDIQVNPFFPYHIFKPHLRHIRKLFKGFMYTLGKTDYLVVAKADYIYDSPFLVWSVKLDDGTYINEYHVDKDNLMKITTELRNQNLIVSTKELTFAHGFSIPYEIFKSNKWEMPKIVIE